MLKFAYFGLVGAFAITLITVSLDRGILSTENRDNLTAGFKLVAEIPIPEKKPEIKKTENKKLETKTITVSAVVIPKSTSLPAPAPVSASVSQPAPVPKPIPTSSPTPVPASEFTPEPASSPTPPPTAPSPEPESTPPPPDPTPVPTPEPTPPPPASEPTPPPSTPAPEPEQPRVLIVEIQTGTTVGGADDEFVKLYNPTNSDIDMAGWKLQQKASSGTLNNLVSSQSFSGKIVAHGYFLIVSRGYKGAEAGNLSYSTSNGLAYKNNSAVLYAADGSAMDEVSWVEIPKDIVWTRP